MKVNDIVALVSMAILTICGMVLIANGIASGFLFMITAIAVAAAKDAAQRAEKRKAMTRSTHGYGSVIGNDTPSMNLSITPRQFAATIGILMAVAGVIALSIPVSTLSDSGIFGASTIDCGSGLADNTSALGGDPLMQCRDAIGGRRAWAWPLLIAGVVVAAAAALVTRAPSTSGTDDTD
jgi:hypothetical protein